jgi:hypothetical protein
MQQEYFRAGFREPEGAEVLRGSYPEGVCQCTLSWLSGLFWCIMWFWCIVHNPNLHFFALGGQSGQAN